MAAETYHIQGGMIGRRAVAFLGGATDDGVQIDSFMAARVLAGDTAGTFSIWFNVPDVTGEYAFIGGGDASAVEYFYISVAAGEIHAKAALAGPDVAWDLVSTDATINPHQWYQVTFVQDGVIPVIYLDGVRLTLTETDITEATYWFSLFTQIDGGHIGCADGVGAGAALTLELAGAIGGIKYWDDALTAAEVVDEYNGHGPSGNLVASWDMDGDFVDSVGGENGTEVGVARLISNYCEFTSRFNHFGTPVVVADKWTFSVNNNTGYAIVVKA